MLSDPCFSATLAESLIFVSCLVSLVSPSPLSSVVIVWPVRSGRLRFGTVRPLRPLSSHFGHFCAFRPLLGCLSIVFRLYVVFPVICPVLRPLQPLSGYFGPTGRSFRCLARLAMSVRSISRCLCHRPCRPYSAVGFGRGPSLFGINVAVSAVFVQRVSGRLYGDSVIVPAAIVCLATDAASSDPCLTLRPLRVLQSLSDYSNRSDCCLTALQPLFGHSGRSLAVIRPFRLLSGRSAPAAVGWW